MSEIQELWGNLIVIDTAENSSSEKDVSFMSETTRGSDSNLWVKRELFGVEIWRLQELCCLYCSN